MSWNWFTTRFCRIQICIMQYKSYFSSKSATFTLQRPSGIVVTLGEDFLKLNPSAANEVIIRESVAVPHINTQLPETFN